MNVTNCKNVIDNNESANYSGGTQGYTESEENIASIQEDRHTIQSFEIRTQFQYEE